MAERVRHLGRAHPSGMLFWGGTKEFADGSLGSRTALFHEPYADAPTTSGTQAIELGRLRELVAAADAAGLQAMRPGGSGAGAWRCAGKWCQG